MKEKVGAKYGLLSAIGLSFGIVVGIGIYFKTGEIAAISQGNVLIGLIAWVFAAIMTIFCGLTFAEYAGATQETGGAITYLRDSSGRLPAFMLGWGKVLLAEPALIIVVSWVAAEFTMGVMGWTGNLMHVLTTFTYVTVMFAINILKPKWGGKVNQ